MKQNENKIKVSVCIVTYNQEKYIRQCLQSIIDQKTDFQFEIIVGDDCSTDNTREIISEFATKFPSIVKPIYHKVNIGGTKNYLAVHDAAIGEYIAHVDGDDFALPGKLSTLADVLDSKPEVNVVWHRLKMMNDKTGELFDDNEYFKLQPADGYTRADLLALGTIGGHSAKMYRSKMRCLLDRNLDEMMDYYVTVEHIGNGRAILIDALLGVYRANVGVMSGKRTETKTLFKKHLLYFLNKYPEYRKEINANALLLLAVDIKKMQNTLAFKLWIYSFHPLSFIEFIRRIPAYKLIRLPKGIA
jgi:glycosyltransferase involved in cell wall biosynthesis